MKRSLIVLCALLLTLSVPAAYAASVVETGTGVQVIKSADWESKFPEIYASLTQNSENKEVVDYVEQYPMIRTIYEGMAFSKYYSSARGHYYTVQDVTETGRPHALANCLTCKTPDFTAKVSNEGVSAYSMKFEDMLAQVNESVGCYNCHANTPGVMTVTHTYLADALGEDLAKVPAKTATCAQCHVEYHFNKDTKATTLPYKNLEGISPDSIYAFYEELGFADYTNPRTGVKQLKVQHPEFETYMGKGSVHAATFSCADCHMAKEKTADGKKYTSHYWVSPLKSEAIKANCAACHADLDGFVKGIQEKAEARTIEVGNKLADLTDKLAEAVQSGKYSEDALEAVRALNRKGQFYWDFVFVENSEGAHNSRLTKDCLDKSEQLIDEAMKLLSI